MSEYLTDEEQVERLKQWWRENGRSIIAGVVIGLGIFGGWQGWRTYELRQAEEGSTAYNKFAQQAWVGDVAATLSAEDALVTEFADSAYADFAGFETARQLVVAGRLEEAAARLKRIHERGATSSVRELARIRLARVLMAHSGFDEADRLLAGEVPPAFAGEAAMVRGDLARLRGDRAAARSAYLQARELGADDEWIDLMLQQVGEETAG